MQNKQADTVPKPLIAVGGDRLLKQLPSRLLRRTGYRMKANKQERIGFLASIQGNFTAALLRIDDEPVSIGIAKRDPNSDANDTDRGIVIAASRAMQGFLNTRRKTSTGGRNGKRTDKESGRKSVK